MYATIVAITICSFFLWDGCEEKGDSMDRLVHAVLLFDFTKARC
ncbi:hypothetical protein SRB521_00922 [Intestinimonas butyriciproducens]|nr:hypothetical protein SRB521_00922 [Intestinimonas butyriciproducens]